MPAVINFRMPTIHSEPLWVHANQLQSPRRRVENSPRDLRLLNGSGHYCVFLSRNVLQARYQELTALTRQERGPCRSWSFCLVCFAIVWMCGLHVFTSVDHPTRRKRRGMPCECSRRSGKSNPRREIMRRRTIWLTWKGLGGIRLPILAVKMRIPLTIWTPESQVFSTIS